MPQFPREEFVRQGERVRYTGGTQYISSRTWYEIEIIASANAARIGKVIHTLRVPCEPDILGGREKA